MSIFKASIKLMEAGQNDYITLKEALHQQAFQVSPHRSQNTSIESEIIATKQGGIHEITGSLLKAVRTTGRKFSFTLIKNKN